MASDSSANSQIGEQENHVQLADLTMTSEPTQELLNSEKISLAVDKDQQIQNVDNESEDRASEARADENVVLDCEGTNKLKVRTRRQGPEEEQQQQLMEEEESGLMTEAIRASPISCVTLKRRKGRPRGSGESQRLSQFGATLKDTAGYNFTPHAVTIQAGEDIVEKIMLFSQNGTRIVMVLSAIGAVAKVEIVQTSYFRGIRYEGHFEILTLSGPHGTYDMDGLPGELGYFTISVANTDGNVFAGKIVGSLIAAGPIQLVLATFEQNLKKRIIERHYYDRGAQIKKLKPLPSASDINYGDHEAKEVIP